MTPVTAAEVLSVASKRIAELEARVEHLRILNSEMLSSYGGAAQEVRLLKAHVRTLREALSGTLPLLVDYSLMLGRGATHAEQQARAALAAADEGVSP